MQRELRTYQKNGIDQIAMKAAKGLMRIVFQLATGGGKTVTFAGLVNRFTAKQPTKVLIVVHREELLRQAHRALFEWYDIVAAPITADNKYVPNVKVYVCMVETLNNRLKKSVSQFGNIGLVIVDECHIGNFKKLYDFFPKSLIIGFTATPVSASKKDPLKNHFQDIVCGIDIPDLIAQGSLCPNRTYHVRNIQRSELKIKNGEFDETQMGSVFSSTKHVQNCIKAYREYGEGKKTIIFNCNIEHSKKVTEAFVAFGYDAKHLDGETPSHERAAILRWFKTTPNAIINNVGILTTGFDEPTVLTVIVNKSTMSLPLWLQMTGRGSRPFEGKNFFTIIDMGGNAITHGDWSMQRDWNDMFFNPDKPKEGGEAPSKECKGCKVVIHASYKTCPHCGADNQKVISYDDNNINISLLTTTKPFEVNVEEVIKEYAGKLKADGTAYKDMAVLFGIKIKIMQHAKRVWRLKTIDQKTADELVKIFQDSVKEWCKLKDKKYSSWYQTTTKEWMYQDFKTTFKWEPQKLETA